MEGKDQIARIATSLYRNRKRLLFLGLIAFVLSAVISLTMPNYYEATTVFYPTSEDLIKPEKLFGGAQTDLRFYGTDAEMDRLMAMAQSPELYDYLIEKFVLTERYGINVGSRQWRSKVRNKLDKHFTIRKTRFDGIELSVEDTDPEIAAQMANSARHKLAEIAERVLKTAQWSMIETMEQSIVEKELLVSMLRDSLVRARQYFGIYNLDAQSEHFAGLISQLETDLEKERVRFEILSSNPRVSRDTLTYLEANLRGMEQQYRFLTEGDDEELSGLRRMNKGMPLIQMLQSQHYREYTQLDYDRMRLKNFRAAFNAPFNAVFVIQEAYPPDRKKRPKRSLIVLGSVFFVVFFGALGIVAMESVDKDTLKKITS
jgi:tyrosine-protein kinase Etk/Wzc